MGLFISWLRWFSLLALAFFSVSTWAAIDATDLAGRNIHLKQPPQRIILGESRYLATLAILDKDQPLRRIVGMLADLKQIDPGTYRQYQAKFPTIANIPLVGHTSADSFNLEQALLLKPDLAIFGLEGHGPNARHSRLISQLEAAGVPVVFLDFRQDPIRNTVKSMALLGKLLQREEQAQRFIDFYEAQLARVLTALPEKGGAKTPTVFLHSRVGLQALCCETMVRGMMASFIDVVSGQNVAQNRIPGSAGVLNLEFLLADQPDIYIATAIGSNAGEHPYIVLGAGVSESQAQNSFDHTLQDSHLLNLRAIKSGHAYAIWHHFYNSPFNVVAIQVFAQWLYPQNFQQLQPEKTLATLFEQFQPVPLDGTYWISAKVVSQ